jgi:hypothetical protein
MEWICVQEVVYIAIFIMLDGEHGSIPGPPVALNPYVLGSISEFWRISADSALNALIIGFNGFNNRYKCLIQLF